MESIKEKLKSPAITAPLLVIFVIAAMEASRFALENLNEDTNIFAAVGVIQLAALGIPCIIYYLLKGRRLESPMYGISKRGPQILIILFSALFFVCGTLFIKFVYILFGASGNSGTSLFSDVSQLADEAGNTEVIISLIVIPAILEELFFRGVVFSEYRKYGTANAVIISAVCFAMLHFSVENFLIYLFSGLLFGFVTAMSRSIFPSVALHILSNTLNIYASDAFLRITVVKNGAYFIGFVLAVATALALILLLSRVETICRSYAEKPPTEEMPPKSISHWAEVFFSPTFVLLAVVFLITALF